MVCGGIQSSVSSLANTVGADSIRRRRYLRVIRSQNPLSGRIWGTDCTDGLWSVREQPVPSLANIVGADSTRRRRYIRVIRSQNPLSGSFRQTGSGCRFAKGCGLHGWFVVRSRTISTLSRKHSWSGLHQTPTLYPCNPFPESVVRIRSQNPLSDPLRHRRGMSR